MNIEIITKILTGNTQLFKSNDSDHTKKKVNSWFMMCQKKIILVTNEL